MSELILNSITSGYNLSLINDNFDKIKDKVDNQVLQTSEGNNTMSQELDMDQHKIINVKSDSSDPNALTINKDLDAVRDYAEQLVAGVVGGYGSFMQTGTGAVVRTFQDKQREIISVKDFGAKGDGTTNDTANIQKALDAGLNIIFPSGQYRIDTTGLFLRSSQIITFQGDASIKLLPHNTSTYQIFHLDDLQNVTINNAILDGSRELNSATTGEFGIAIRARGCSNLNLRNIKTTGCWGDGIYIGPSAFGGLPYCEKVIIENHYSYNDRRQGLSIISAKGLKVLNPIWEFVNGTPPSRGCDIEPNDNTNILQDIRFINPRTINCEGFGIGFSPARIAGTNIKYIDVVIDNHFDDGSLCGAGTSSLNTTNGTVLGSVTWNNPTWTNTLEGGFRSRNYSADGPTLNIINPVVYNINTTENTSAKYSSAFITFRETTDTGDFDIGGLIVSGATVIEDVHSLPNIYQARTYAGTYSARNCAFIDPIFIRTSSFVNSTIAGKGFIRDIYNKYISTPTGSSTISLTTVCGKTLTPNVANTQTLSSSFEKGSPDIVVEVGYAVATNVAPPTGGIFVGQIANARFRSTVPGSYLRIRPLGSNVFSIIEQVGTWTVV